MSEVQPNSSSTCKTPAWLSIEFLQEIIRTDRQQPSLIVNAFTAKPAVAKGENYSSDLLRVRVQITDAAGESAQEVALMVKIKLTEELESAALIEEMNIFVIEINAYNILMPRIHKLLQSIGDDTQLAPKCLAADLKNGYLIFEDLSETGYYMVDRHNGIDMPHFRLTLDRLAKWHAATVRILEQDPEVGRKFLPVQFEKHFAPWRSIVENHVRTLADYCALHPHLAHLQPKLASQVATIYDRLCEQCNDDSIGGLRALCHGDLWSNNVLFRDDLADGAEKRPVDAKLIDFQQVFSGSPTLDLLLLLHGASQEDLRQDDWDQLVQHYHTVYVRTLHALGFEAVDRIPTLTELHVQMLRLCECGAYVSLMMIGGRNLGGIAEDPVTHYFNDSEADRRFRLDALLDRRCTKSLDYLLTFFDRKGIFD